MSDQRVVVVTGGGNGIGAAIAAECKRQGWYVVTVDPMVSLDGSEKVADAPPMAGDRAVELSVTDRDGVGALFAELPRLDAVINVAGISRPTSFTRGTEADWRAVLDVHLNGYLSVLNAALPVMADAGYGRIVGVTSGSGWRAADTGAYGCAKRAVAALTWHLGRLTPPGVTLNAMSPIAVTRMVTAALGRAPAQGASATTGGLNLGSMPQPEEIGPMGAYLAGDTPGWMSGEIVFAGGPESAVIEPPRLLEMIRTDGVGSVAHLLEATLPALLDAETTQTSGGGSNPRFDLSLAGELGAPAVATCAVVSDRAEFAAAISDALAARKVAQAPLESADAVIVATSGAQPSAGDWQGILAEHADIAERIYGDARVARQVADARRPMRLVTLTDATTSAGRSRAQAAAQLARAARGATKGNVSAFAVAVEANSARQSAEFAAHLICGANTPELSGAELAVGDGWVGVRSHPRPSASVVLGGPSVPEGFGDFLRETLR